MSSVCLKLLSAPERHILINGYKDISIAVAVKMCMLMPRRSNNARDVRYRENKKKMDQKLDIFQHK